jgi:hypothetical protein
MNNVLPVFILQPFVALINMEPDTVAGMEARYVASVCGEMRWKNRAEVKLLCDEFEWRNVTQYSKNSSTDAMPTPERTALAAALLTHAPAPSCIPFPVNTCTFNLGERDKSCHDTHHGTTGRNTSTSEGHKCQPTEP